MWAGPILWDRSWGANFFMIDDAAAEAVNSILALIHSVAVVAGALTAPGDMNASHV